MTRRDRSERVGFGHGPLARKPAEKLARLAQAIIARETGCVPEWIWNDKPVYGGLYPSLTVQNKATMVDVDAHGTLIFFVSVGRDNRDRWVTALRAAGHTARAMGDDEFGGSYPGKVHLELTDPLDVADDVVRQFISAPFRNAA